MDILIERLRRSPVIAAVRSCEELDTALITEAEVFFVLGGEVSALRSITDRIRAAGGLGLLHLDLLDGLGKDEAAVRFLAREIGAAGIVSTRANLIRKAKAEGMQAVQRIFLLDSASIETGVKMSQQSGCDAVEVMPGLVYPELAHRLESAFPVPIIAGGLITERVQVERILKAGAIGVSTGQQTLWQMRCWGTDG